MVHTLKQQIRAHVALIVLVISIICLYVADATLSGVVVGGAGEMLPIVLVAGLLLLSSLASALAKGTIFPSFLVAVFIGLALHDVLAPIIGTPVVLHTVVTVSAVYILFSGGLEIAYASFKKILFPTLLLSTVGLCISTFVFPIGLLGMSAYFDIGMTVTTALLLGAILASTDPAAIIPVIKELRFKKTEIKDIAISESALTDVTGALVTFAFLFYLGTNGYFSSVWEGVSAIGSSASVYFLIKEILIGVLAGLIGFAMLHVYLKRRTRIAEQCSDVSLFIAVPLVAFAIAALFHGSGYLASFIAGLLIVTHEKVHKTEAFFINLTDGIAKPLIFIFLGAMVQIQDLLALIVPGIVAGIIFICIVRPLSVFASLYFFRKKTHLTIRELWFISSVRETGVIPAVLLLQTMSVPGLSLSTSFLGIGMWVIIMTLVVLPPITPWIARKLQVAE
jgi:NhaP-type Na+/H+ or K+/H+ antiporter